MEQTSSFQLLNQQLQKKKGIICNCIRCREIKGKMVSGEPKFEIIEYNASHGKEFFISLADETDKLLGFARLRFPSQSLRKEISMKSGLLRELHVYGKAIGLKSDGKVQHKGFGTQLVEKAEEICRENGKNKLIVISGVGVREYYRKFGYSDDGPYVSKELF
ncbi:GNAT family N-acetyltransferase [Bacteroidota bacterium]